MFDPKCDKFPYPMDTGSHYLNVKSEINLNLDENYNYIDESKKFTKKLKWFRFVLRLIVFPMTKIRLNLKVKGKKNLKENKELLSNGCITVCNHVHMWDFLAIMYALRKTDIKFLAWKENMEASNRNLVKLAGGIPIPDGNMKGYVKFYKEINNYLNNKGWLHIYSEGSMWEFYKPIRPFKDGASHFSIKSNKPILPLGISYRKNGFIRKLFKSPASLTITIGKPIMPILDKPFREAKDELTIKVHKAICEMTDNSDNIYEPIYNNNQRIDYYTNEYGKNYKKSW